MEKIFALGLLASVLSVAEARPRRTPSAWQWDALDPTGLTTLARSLRRSAPCHRVEEFSDYVANRYEWVSSSGDIDIGQWLDLAIVLGRELPQETKHSMRSDLKRRLADSTESLLGRGGENTAKVCAALANLGLEELARPIALEWIEKSQALGHLPIEGLANLSHALANADDQESRAAREVLIDRATEILTHQGDHVRSAPRWAWPELIRRMAPYLPARERGRWRDALESCFLAETLCGDDFVDLAWAIRFLDRSWSTEFAASWMERRADWQTWRLPEIGLLARFLDAGGNATRAHRLKLLRHLSSSLLFSREKLLSVDTRGLLQLVDLLRGDMSRLDRCKWLRGLETAFGEEALPADEFLPVATAAFLLDREKGSAFTANWMAQHDEWRSWDPRHLARLRRCLAGSAGSVGLARSRLTNLVATRFLPTLSAARAVSCADWEGLAASFGKDLSESQRSRWHRILGDSFADKELDAASFVSLVRAMGYLDVSYGCQFAITWMAAHKVWQSWDPESLLSLSQTLKGVESDAVMSTRRELAENAVSVLSAADQLQKDPQGLYALVLQFGPDLPPERRADVAARIRATFAPDQSKLLRLSPRDLSYLVRVLKRLGDTEAQQLIHTWCAHVRERTSVDPGDLVALADGHLRRSDRDKVALRQLTESISPEDVDEDRFSLHLRSFMRCAAYFAQHMTEERRCLWAARLWTVFEDILGGAAKSDEETAEELTLCLRALGAEELRELVACELKALRGQTISPAADWPSVLKRDWSWPILFWRVIAARPEERGGLWKKGIGTLQVKPVYSLDKVLLSLDHLIVVLGHDDPSSLPAEEALTDLMAVTTDYSTAEALRSRLRDYRLKKCLSALPPQAKTTITEAHEHAESGRLQEAYGLYDEAVCQLEEGGQRGEANVLRREALDVLLAQGSCDIEVAKHLIDTLAADQKCSIEEAWNLRCRALFKEVAQAKPENRRVVWSEGATRLTAGGVRIFGPTLAALDSLVDTIDVEDPSLVFQVLNDLLLVVPDLPSMRRIQERRVSVLAEQENDEDVVAAALFELVLAASGSQWPGGTVERCLGLAAAQGFDCDEFGLPHLSPLALARGGDGQATGKPEGRLVPCVDRRLEVAAKAALGQNPTGMSPRRKVFLNLFAGRSGEAVSYMHNALSFTSADFYELAEGFDEMAVVVSVRQGRFWFSNGILTALVFGNVRETKDAGEFAGAKGLAPSAPTGRTGKLEASTQLDATNRHNALPLYHQLPPEQWASVNKKLLQRRNDRMMLWGIDALQAGNQYWPQLIWARAIDCQSSELLAARSVDDVIVRAEYFGCSASLDNCLAQTVTHLKNNTGRGHLLLRSAEISLGRGRPLECLTALDLTSHPSVCLTTDQVISMSLLRAKALLAMDRYEDATEALKKTSNLGSSNEQRGEALFLQGWLHLRQARPDEARRTLGNLLDWYPYTRFAVKAKAILDRLEAKDLGQVGHGGEK